MANFLEKNDNLIIIIVVLIEFILTIFTIKYYKKNKNENLYSYKTASLLGGCIFLTFVFFILLIMALACLSYDNKILNFISFISQITSYFMLLSIPFTIIFFIFMGISNISLIYHEGKRLINILGALFSFFIVCSTISVIFGWDIIYQNIIFKLYIKGYDWINIVNLTIQMFLGSLVCYLDCLLIGVIICNLKALKLKINYDKDYVIILGCGISKDGKPLPLLKGRIDHAIDFYKKQLKNSDKEIIFIVSGGKGKNEVISEALSMKNYLISKGIKESNILMEDKSTSTLENLKFSKKLIKEKNAKIIYSTTNYHVFRAGIYARMIGLNAYGIGAKTKWFFWPNAFIREFIALLVNNKKSHIINIFIFFIICLIIGYLNYILL